MSEESKVQEQIKYKCQNNTVKFFDVGVQRSMNLDDAYFVCDCTDCNTFHGIGRDDLEPRAEDVGYDAQQMPLERVAHSDYREVSFIPSGHHIRLSNRKMQNQQEKHQLNIDQQHKKTVFRRKPMKYLQTIRRLTSNLKNAAIKLGFLKSKQTETKNQKVSCLLPVSLEEKLSKCKKMPTGNKIRKGPRNDLIFQSPSNHFVTIHRRKQYKESNIYFTKSAAIDMLLKLKLTLKSYIDGAIVKSRTLRKCKSFNHMSYDRQPVIFNYIFPYQCSSSNIIQETSDDDSDIFCELNASSTIVLASNSSIEYFNDHHTQRIIGLPIFDVEPCVRNISIFNMFRSDSVLVRSLNNNTRTNSIKSLRRVTLKRPHKRIINKSRQKFSKKYQTYYAEVSYTKEKLDLSPEQRQAVRVGSTWDCNQDNSEFGDTNKNGMLPQYQCLPGVCTAGKCNPKKCLKRIKRTVPYGSHAATQSCMSKKALRKGSKKKQKGREAYLASNPLSLPSQGVPRRQKNRITSKTGPNVQLCKELPIDGRSTRKKSGRAKRKRKALKAFECPPGTCVSKRCKPGDCYRQLKAADFGNISGPSLCSDSYGSHIGTQSKNKNKWYSGKGKQTFYKDKGVSSMPRPKLQLNLPNRETVRIGSKCSLNSEIYKRLPHNGFETNQFTQGNMFDQQKTRTRKKSKSSEKYSCEPGVCVPGQCDANACFQQLKYIHSQPSLTGISQSCQASKSSRKKILTAENTTYYRDRGSSSMQKPKISLPTANRQAVRIGSKCSFNIDIYRSIPHNGYVTNEYQQGDAPIQQMTQENKSRCVGGARKQKPLKKYQCEPGICVPGQCNANACIQQFRPGQAYHTGNSIQGSQASTNSSLNNTFYKDTGSSSMPRAKTPLHIPNRQAVRIGSKYSFNIEFYRSMPQNGNAMNRYGQDGSGIGPKPRIECESGVCIPSKCNPNECFITLKAKNRMSGSSFSGCSNAMSQGSQAATWRENNILQGEPVQFYRDRGVSSMPVNKRALLNHHRQAVRIASKCSFNIEFYKNMPQNGYVTPNYSENLLSNSYHQGNTYATDWHGSGNKKKNKTKHLSKCEPGVCIPGKCNANECFKRIKGIPMGFLNETSHCGSSSGRNPAVGQAYNTKVGNEFVSNDKNIATISRHKPTLHLPNRQAVRIGSKFSFNVEFYKSLPQRGPMVGQNYEHMENSPSHNNQMRSHQYSEQYNQISVPVRDCPCVPVRCKASTEKKSKSRKSKKIKPMVGIPVKCECFPQILQSSYSDAYASCASQASRMRTSNGPDIYAGNTTFYKERGVSTMPRGKRPLHIPNRQAVRIGSTCSFDIEFYKTSPGKDKPHYAQQNQYKQYLNQYYLPSSEMDGQSLSAAYPSASAVHYQSLYDQGNATICRDTGTEIKRRMSKCRQKRIKRCGKRFYCEPGVCIPNKCDPYLCFERLKTRESNHTDLLGFSNDLEVTPINSGMSKAASANLDRREEAERRSEAMTVYRNQGSSTVAYNKNKDDRLQPISTLRTTNYNKNMKHGVRIGSRCRFNIKLYKDKPLTTTHADAIRLASISPFVSEAMEERNGLMSYLRNCCCKFIGKTGRDLPTSHDQSRLSQTRQGLECVRGLCNFDKCLRNDCPARMTLMETCVGTPMRNRDNRVDLPPYSTNAATQSRRYPLSQQAMGYDGCLNSNVCKFCGRYGPSRLYPTLRRTGSNMGNGDYLNGRHIEQAVIIGSGCGFNIKFFRKHKK